MSKNDIAGRDQAQAETDGETGKTRTHVFEDMTIGKNVDLIMLSTNEDLMSVKTVTVEDGTRHWGGHMSDSTVQQLSRDRATGPPSIKPNAAQAVVRKDTNFTGMGQRI
jgi:hypothetical protein